jgi:hypothetical protein
VFPGANNDLVPWFRHDDDLLAPIRLCGMAADLLEGYEKKRHTINDQGVFIGRARLVILTSAHRGRLPYGYEHMEFFRPGIEAVYTPVFTLDEMIREGRVDYRPGWLVERFAENEGGIDVYARPVNGGEIRTFRSRKLLLGAGALNTARIVLSSAGDMQTRLPIMDNRMVCFPVFRPHRLGMAIEPEDASVGQLNIICEGIGGSGAVQATFYGTNGPLRTDVLCELPLPVRAARTFLKHTASATALTMLFYPDVIRPENYLSLMENGSLFINYLPQLHNPFLEHKLIRILRKVGYYSHPSLLQYPSVGSSLHYAGMLPMRKNPGNYECFPNGRLSGTRGVYVLDGACFPALPSKNLTFTIMANAMRIVRHAAGDI